MLKCVLHRENLFQKGMQEHCGLLDGYEVFPGRKLLATSPMERYDLAEQWTDDMSEARLRCMDIEEAVAILAANTRADAHVSE